MLMDTYQGFPSLNVFVSLISKSEAFLSAWTQFLQTSTDKGLFAERHVNKTEKGLADVLGAQT